jgi:hypothetical protein
MGGTITAGESVGFGQIERTRPAYALRALSQCPDCVARLRA